MSQGICSVTARYCYRYRYRDCCVSVELCLTQTVMSVQISEIKQRQRLSRLCCAGMGGSALPLHPDVLLPTGTPAPEVPVGPPFARVFSHVRV